MSLAHDMFGLWFPINTLRSDITMSARGRDIVLIKENEAHRRRRQLHNVSITVLTEESCGRWKDLFAIEYNLI
ncbi:MAG TPA: hypothetical protein DCK99_22005 [Blastocatellia bacterium]|nr:hypothetical protein [Blastocatellia bacterium]